MLESSSIAQSAAPGPWMFTFQWCVCVCLSVLCCLHASFNCCTTVTAACFHYCNSCACWFCRGLSCWKCVWQRMRGQLCSSREDLHQSECSCPLHAALWWAESHGPQHAETCNGPPKGWSTISASLLLSYTCNKSTVACVIHGTALFCFCISPKGAVTINPVVTWGSICVLSQSIVTAGRRELAFASTDLVSSPRYRQPYS